MKQSSLRPRWVVRTRRARYPQRCRGRRSSSGTRSAKQVASGEGEEEAQQGPCGHRALGHHQGRVLGQEALAAFQQARQDTQRALNFGLGGNGEETISRHLGFGMRERRVKGNHHIRCSRAGPRCRLRGDNANFIPIAAGYDLLLYSSSTAEFFMKSIIHAQAQRLCRQLSKIFQAATQIPDAMISGLAVLPC